MLHSSKIGKANLDVFNPCIELSRRGHTVHLVTRRDMVLPKLQNIIEQEGVIVHLLAFQSLYHSFALLPIFVVKSLSAAHAVDPDLLVVENNVHCPFVGALIGKILNKRVLFLLRELTVDNTYHDPSKGVLKKYLSWVLMTSSHILLRRVRYVLSINRGIAHYYQPFLKKSIPSIWLLSFFLSSFDIPQDILRDVSERYQIRSESLKILYTGALAPDRDIETVLQAVHRLSKREAVQIIITGEGPARERLQRKAKELGLGEQTLFLGWLPMAELNAIIRLADVGVEPYHRLWPQDHTPSSKVASYVAAGLFVLATKAPGYEEIIINGENGYLYEDIEDMTAFLQGCLDQPQKIASLRVTSQQHRHQVDIVPTVDRIERIVDDIVNHRTLDLS